LLKIERKPRSQTAPGEKKSTEKFNAKPTDRGGELMKRNKSGESGSKT